MNGEIDQLFFGRDDAETDMADGGLLRAGFVATAAYRAARDARKRLILGRKGSGKSAICQMLAAENDPNLAAALVTPDGLSAESIRDFEPKGIPPESAKALIWRYVLAVQVGKYTVRHAKASHRMPRPRSIAAVKKFLIANGELSEPKPIFSQIVQKLNTSISLEAFGIKASANFGGQSEGERISNQIQVIETSVKRAISDLSCGSSHPRLVVLVDEVEDVWSNDPQSNHLVIGLLHAARRIASTFPKVDCVTFLRSDIYDMLRFADKDKLHSDELRVDWDGGRLLDLALLRASASLNRELSPEDLWGKIFPSHIGGIETARFIVSCTLMRPRDIIHLCNLCSEKAVQHAHPSITETDVRAAIDQYSIWKRDDLCSEYSVNYPYLDKIVKIFYGSGYVVMRSAFEEKCAQLLSDLQEGYPSDPDVQTSNGLLDMLYRVGFLGVRRAASVHYLHQGGNDRIELTDKEFHIHPSFRHALNAEAAAIREPYIPAWQGEARTLVRRHFRTSNVKGQSTSIVTDLVPSLGAVVSRIASALDGADLPPAVHEQMNENLIRILSDNADIADSDSSSSFIINRIIGVARWLIEASRQLERGHFGDANNSASDYIRSIGEAGSRLREEALAAFRS
jgi:hypothetical protein